MYKVIRSKLAREDVKNITRYIAKDNPSRAITFTHKMVNNFQNKVSTFPKAGVKCIAKL